VRSATTLLAAALLALTAAPAGAAEVTASLQDPDGVRFGDDTMVSGAVTEAGVPQAAQPVVLEVRRYPYRGAWRPRDRGVTGDDGSFGFVTRLDRNHRIRVRHETTGALSRELTAFVFPAFQLAFREVRRGVIRITQTYRVPRGVRLTAPTRFYVGSQAARRVRLRAIARTRRVRAGRYRAVARVRIPARFRGQFRYVSCFPYSPGSGMGDPSRRCPRRYFRVR
jgi:hypothetical protein